MSDVPDMVAFLRARYDEVEATIVVPDAFAASVLMDAATRAEIRADLKAKRAILDAAVHNEDRWAPEQTDDYDLSILPALCEPYADHPDSQRRWYL